MSNIDNIVDMTIKRVHTNNKMNSVTDNSRLINELQLQEEPIRLSSRELFKTSKFYRTVLIINMVVIVIAMLIAGFGSMRYKAYEKECYPYGLGIDVSLDTGGSICSENEINKLYMYNNLAHNVPFIIILCLIGIDFILLIIGFFVDRQSFRKLLLYYALLILLVWLWFMSIIIFI